MKALLLLLLLAGCATPTVTLKTIDGIQYVEHLDEQDNPCGNRSHKAGCAKLVNGEWHVWYSSVSPRYVKTHELAHVKGVVHLAWEKDEQGRLCAKIIFGNDDYPAGKTICIDGKRETVL